MSGGRFGSVADVLSHDDDTDEIPTPPQRPMSTPSPSQQRSTPAKPKPRAIKRLERQFVYAAVPIEVRERIAAVARDAGYTVADLAVLGVHHYGHALTSTTSADDGLPMSATQKRRGPTLVSIQINTTPEQHKWLHTKHAKLSDESMSQFLGKALSQLYYQRENHIADD